jgi:hypothetical protein
MTSPQVKRKKMKKLILRKFLLLILYTLIYLYFTLFNWEIFTVSLKINLGFAVVGIPPFIILFLLGFIIIGILSWVSYVSHLQKLIYELEHGIETREKKDIRIKEKVKAQLLTEENIKLLKEKTGIREIASRQEKLIAMMDELKSQLKS